MPKISEVVQQTVAEFPETILKALRKGPISTNELADSLDCSPRRLKETLSQMSARGILIREYENGILELTTPEFSDKIKTVVKATKEIWNHRFGITSDNHLVNKHSRLDVLNAAYETFEREGITDVLNAGNWSDGDHKFTRPERIIRPGMDPEIDYVIDNWPQRKGITTHFIAGDDHEGWYQQRECIEIGRYLEMRAQKAGRQDLRYLGYAEADIELKSPGGSAVCRVVHPGGGSAYALSYTTQKLVESYQGGEKPQITVVGHYHKYDVNYMREVLNLQPGCTCDQTLFMRKKKIQAHVGYCILEVMQDRSDGHIVRMRHEWFPFYDRKFYERRYGM